MTDSRKLVKVDERFPASLAGEAGKQIVVSDDEATYEHVDRYSGAPVASLILYMFDALPTGYIPTNATYNFDDYPTLGALFGAVSGGTFTVPEILFIKNSNGVNTGTQEAEEVGTHGHGAQALGNHDHVCSARSVGNHDHDVLSVTGPAGTGGFVPDSFGNVWEDGKIYPAGAHTHIIDLNNASAGTPVINNHVGTNQPACTLINIGIKF